MIVYLFGFFPLTTDSIYSVLVFVCDRDRTSSITLRFMDSHNNDNNNNILWRSYENTRFYMHMVSH